MLQEVLQFFFWFSWVPNCSIDWVGSFSLLVVEYIVDFSSIFQKVVGFRRFYLQFYVKGWHFSFRLLDRFRWGRVCCVSFLQWLFFCVFPFRGGFPLDWIRFRWGGIFSWWPWFAWFLRFSAVELWFGDGIGLVIRWVFVSLWWLQGRYSEWKIYHFPLSSLYNKWILIVVGKI